MNEFYCALCGGIWIFSKAVIKEGSVICCVCDGFLDFLARPEQFTWQGKYQGKYGGGWFKFARYLKTELRMRPYLEAIEKID